LRAAPGEAEARHDFVENQERIVLIANVPQELEKSGPRRIQPGIARHRLDDDSGDLPGIRFEKRANGFLVIERREHRMLRERGGHARAVWMSERERARSRLDQKGISMPVVASLEL
jgi:hypothetical protein